LVEPGELLDFWFKETPAQRWFDSDPIFDALLKNRFAQSWREARGGAAESWRNTGDGALALILLFDQFPRNMFRGTAQAFATDALARDVAHEAVSRGFDWREPPVVRHFFYLPFTHSEALADQEFSVRLTGERVGEQSEAYAYALRHRQTIVRFGRFPARNAALGRLSTPDERNFLRQNPLGL
jgi:uncharacterized protein (DUF924 family)